MKLARVAATAAILVAVACSPQAGASPSPAPTATASPTAERPRFELATYMYALQTKGKIRVAVLDRAAPFASTDAAGAHAGFEVDLGRELAKAIFGPQQAPDRVIEWISVDASTGISALTSEQTDVTIARLVAPPPGQRTELGPPIDYSAPYFTTGIRVLVRSDSDEIKDLPDLDSRTTCVIANSVADRVTDANPFAKTLTLDTYASCLGALRNGQVDAIAADEAALWGLIAQDAKTKLVGRNVTTERYAIGVKKSVAADREGFLPFVDAWLATLARDGTWARLYAQDIAPVSHEAKTAP